MRNLSLSDDRFLVRIQMLERDAGAFGHAEERFVGEDGLHARAPEDEFWKIAELGSAARHDDAAVDNIGRKFRRRLLKHVLDGFDHGSKFFVDSLHDLVGRDLDRAREPSNEIAALDGELELVLNWNGRAYLYFYLFGGFVADP